VYIIEKTPCELISHNVENETYTQYDSTKTDYVAGYFVLYNDNIYKYKATVSETGKQPDLNPLYWEDNGAINSLKWNDKFINSQTIKGDSDDLVLVVKPYIFNSVSFFNVDAESVTITIGDYVKHINLMTVQISNWSDFFFNDIEYKKDMFTKLPIFFNPEVTITLKGSNPKVGNIIFGKIQESGFTLFAPTAGYDDYSKFEKNEDGFISIVEGKYSKRANFKVVLETNKADGILKKMYSLRNKLSVFVGSERYEGLILFGKPNNFEEIYSNATTSEYNMEIEGVI
jgi:hypothetical protein